MFPAARRLTSVLAKTQPSPWRRPRAFERRLWPSLLCCGLSSEPHARFEVEKSYSILGLSSDASEEEVKHAYIKLAKELHPDRSTGDQEKFVKITEAYQRLTQQKTQPEQMQEFLEWLDAQLKEQEERERYRHKAPQHRQYLEYNAGGGTVFQRQRQAQKNRVERAYENVSDKKVERLKGVDAHSVDVQARVAARRARITNAIDRLVEDLIQEAISKGDFDNLKGKGKPLPEKQYHYVSRTEEKLNEFLINSGCLPQWIEMEKEIRETSQGLRAKLEESWQQCGPEPMPAWEEMKWTQAVHAFTSSVDDLNKKVRNFNLIVPIASRQRCMMSVDKELVRVKALPTLPHGQKPHDQPPPGQQESPTPQPMTQRIRSLLRFIIG